MKPYTLRAVLPSDRPWLWTLRQAALRAYVEKTWGVWDDALQKRFFEHTFFSPSLRIIVSDEGADVGMLLVERRGSEFHVSTLEIFPSFQRRGIGTALLTDLQSEARRASKPIRLQVLRVNPARGWYRRLGFNEIGETETHVLLDWKP